MIFLKMPSFSDRVPALGIRMNLAILVIGCILPVATISAFLIFNFYEHEQTRLIGSAISRARAIVTSVDQVFDNTQASLQVLGTSHRLTNGDLAGFHSWAIEVLDEMQAESIMSVDLGGQLLISTRTPYGKPLPLFANPRLLKQVMETGRPAVSDLYFASVTKDLLFTIGVPISRNGAVVSLLGASVSPAHLSRMLAHQKLPETWIAAVVDSSGNIAARTRNIDKFLNAKISPAVLRQLVLSDEGSLKNRTKEGIPVLSVFSHSPTTKWAVVIGMPLNEITAGLHQTLLRLCIGTLTALAIGLALAWLIGGRIAKSVTAIGKSALALNSGQQLDIPRLYFKEAIEMACALQTAESALRKSRYDAHHDALTGLKNRTLFRLVVNQQLALCGRNGTDLAILYIDLDGFKAVNDTHGHEIGDQLLCAVSVRITDAIRDSDIAARLGGDEFGIALIRSNLEDAKSFAGKLIDVLSEPYHFGEVEAKISASIGISGYPASATEIDTLLKQADKSMYRAKAMGKRRFNIAQIQ
ncbi:MAG: hypothetical protein JWP38_1648 [Herbaspirillum sp.]|jgi:diguanylate cyclase (GGDEF)-like protein|nr:hypothetical protein [Herbaspirillum sp.]